MQNKEKLLKEIESWLGTNFKYQGRIKKNDFNNGGVDCLGLILKVCDNVDYTYKNKNLSFYDDVIYSNKPNYDTLKERFSLFFNQKQPEELEIGDIILQKVSKSAYHLMFYSGENAVIHASAKARKVVECGIYDFDEAIIYSLKGDL